MRLSNKFFEVEKDYRKNQISIIKYSEIEHVPLGEFLIDLNKFKMLYKTLGIRDGLFKENRFKEPKEEDLYYFDYGYDLKFIYDEIRDFYNEVGNGELIFYDIEEGLYVPIFKYLKLKFSYYSMNILNNFYKCEILLYSNRLKELTFEELSILYKITEKENCVEDMFKVSVKTLELLKVNKTKILEYVYYAEYLYNDLNYDYSLVDRFYMLLSDYGILEDYNSFLKCIEIIRHNSDLHMVVDYLTVCKQCQNSREELIESITVHLKKCRKEASLRIPYSSNILSSIMEEKRLKDERIDNVGKLKERIDDLLGLFNDGYITEFSELVLDLKEVYSEEDFKIVMNEFKKLFKESFKLNNDSGE